MRTGSKQASEIPCFDQNAQVATGFAAKEDEPDKPQFSPVFYLGDLMAGHFAMAAAGRVWLARSVMWLQELGFLVAEKDTYPAKVTSIDSVYGKLSFLAPPLSISNLVPLKKSNLTPYGADTPEWRD